MIDKIIKILGGYTQEDFVIKEATVKALNCENQTLNRDFDNLFEMYKPYEKYESLEEYKKQIYDKATIIQYDGGRPAPKPLHKFLEMDETTEKNYIIFIKSFTKNMKFNTPDDVVFKVNNKLNKTYDFTDIYVKDKGEYWLTSYEAMGAIVLGFETNGLDCEDISIFKYCCFKTALKLQGWWFHERAADGYWESNSDNEWRLRLCRVNLLHAENHVMLAWCRGDNGKNVGWFPIESSYHPDKFEAWWNAGVRMDYTNPVYESIDYTWDCEKEYKRLLK